MRSLSTIVRLALATLLSCGVAAGHASAEPTAPLTLKVYNAGPDSFHANATVIYGKTEALLIDTGFTRADAYRIAADVLDTGKPLRTILVSNADPDYYFGAEVLKELFPQARVVSTPAVRAKIQEKLQNKVGFWAPKMGANAPRKPVVPDVLQGTTLTVDGEVIELRGTTGELAHRPYVWIPSLKAIAGNVGVYGNLHVWTADTQTPSAVAAWLAQLDEMERLKPDVVVPGHMAAGTRPNASAIRYTRDYVRRFQAEAARAKNAAQLIAAMKKAYPRAGLPIALDIGAKVTKGEMKW
jgi:glyoxylase-like metal-dependent hydrolase (beta-lactamase superfamily II)